MVNNHKIKDYIWRGIHRITQPITSGLTTMFQLNIKGHIKTKKTMSIRILNNPSKNN